MNQSRRYLHVVESFSTGVFSWILDVATRQAKDGHEVIIAHSVREETPANFRQLFPAGIELVELPMCREIHPFRDLKSILALAQLIRRRTPDVVHLHSSKAGVVGRIAALLARSDSAFFYTPHGLAHLRQDVSPFKRWLFRSIEQLAGHLRGQVLACSLGEYEALARMLPRGRVIRLDNAIDCQSLRSQYRRGPRNANEVTICTLGGIRYQKAPWVFEEVARRIGHQLGDARVRWLWVGDGDEQYVSALKRAGVEITGWLSRDEALAKVNGCDIYIQTSLWEGLSLSILEAQCLGLPAVVSDCAGNRDAISVAYTGYVASSTDEYVTKLNSLISSAELRQRFSMQAQLWVEQRYSLERLLRDLDAVYMKGKPLRENNKNDSIADPTVSKVEGG